MNNLFQARGNHLFRLPVPVPMLNKLLTYGIIWTLSSFFIAGLSSAFAQSPHDPEMVIDCGQCHTASGWEVDLFEIEFDHNTESSFELEGVHERTDCKLCHSSLVFEEAPSTCTSCHEDVHSMSVGNDCVRCHTAESWLVDLIPELHEENGFPLIGAHTNLSCVECHTSETNLRFDRIGNECVSCHLDDYVSAENPRHDNSGFSTNCTDCHNPLGFEWDADPIGHDFFPLTLGHDIQDCGLCHTTGTFADASPDCVGCHQMDYQEAMNPPHVDLGLSTDCKSCHTIDPGWMPATFDIHDSFYPLNGAHADIANDCAACHHGSYANTPNTCFGCHESDYNDTDDPNHKQAGFSTDCTICHNEDDWEPSTFDHDGQYFPIFSGTHQGEWNACTDCHNVQGDYSIFTCLTCHKKNDTDDEHNDVNDYVYNSLDCLRCHPDGEE